MEWSRMLWKRLELLGILANILVINWICKRSAWSALTSDYRWLSTWPGRRPEFWAL